MDISYSYYVDTDRLLGLYLQLSARSPMVMQTLQAFLQRQGGDRMHLSPGPNGDYLMGLSFAGEHPIHWKPVVSGNDKVFIPDRRFKAGKTAWAEMMHLPAVPNAWVYTQHLLGVPWIEVSDGSEHGNLPATFETFSMYTPMGEELQLVIGIPQGKDLSFVMVTGCRPLKASDYWKLKEDARDYSSVSNLGQG